MYLTVPFATFTRTHRVFRMLCCGLLLIAVASVPHAAWAYCTLVGGGAPTVNFNAQVLALTINTQPSTTTPIWQSGVITPPGNTTITCDNDTSSGITMSVAGPPTGGDDTLFPTNIPGISYRLRHIAGTTQYTMPSYPNYTLTPRTNSPLSGTTQMFLYYTGPYLPPNGGTMVGALSQWQADIRTCTGPWWNQTCNTSQQAIEYFTVNVKITVSVPTCNVDPGSINKVVTLASVTKAQLTTNQTAGKMPFSLQLVNCPKNQKVFINLNTASPFAGGTGVIAPSGSGYATNVGVQILKADGSTPVTFGDDPTQAINTGATSGSSYAINLFARYYRTGTPVGAGSVKGIATYTINYQ